MSVELSIEFSEVFFVQISILLSFPFSLPYTSRNSINAQKLYDEKSGPDRSIISVKEERRSRDFDHFMVAHSSLKASEGGYKSSTKSYAYYSDLAEARKEELKAKFNKN